MNLPTVPGDVLVGAAAVAFGAVRAGATGPSPAAATVAAACVASVFLYMFGLVDNDIVGAGTDICRPIPDGEISLGAARLARGLCLFAAFASGAAANLPPAWWVAALALFAATAAYNRTKWCLAMGLCRGLDVFCGGAALMPGVRGVPVESRLALFAAAAAWTVYVAAVTKYSEGEENDPARRRRVGFLVGAIVYLQLVALMVFGNAPFLAAGAAMLVLTRLCKRLLPEVEAS